MFVPLRAALLLSTLLLVFAPARLAAQPAAQDPDEVSLTEEQKADAKDRYLEGVKAYKAQRFKDAVDLFLEADALVPSAALSFNIARAYEKLGDDAAALRWYRDYLRRDPEASDREQVAKLIAKYEERLQAKGVQQLTVLSKPRGATVVIGGEPVGVTPWTGELAPGTHRVAVERRGYAVTERSVELPAEHAVDVEVRLVPERPKSAAAPAADPSGEAPPAPVATQPRDAAPPPERGVRPLTWITLGVGVAGLATAGVFEVLRRGAENDARNERVQLDYLDALDRHDSYQQVARIALVAGGAVTLAGGVLLFLDLSRGGTETARAEPSGVVPGAGCLPSGCWVSARGRF